ncbi:MAG: Crp/Fnr family transcriptional regulator, partial [Boseongicola sp.]|nr:Crp/Fnr family transcriptional regulator [Boseongicola sp.]
MSNRTRQLVAPKGATIFTPGQACPGFVVLRKGTMRVSLTGENGREVVLYRVQPGDICLQTFSCLINDESYRAEGVAESDLEGYVIPMQAFREKLANDPDFREDLFVSVANRFTDFENLVEDVALTGFDARLARVLLKLRDDGGVVHTTHDQLARETASGRAFVSRRLAEFARDELVEL